MSHVSQAFYGSPWALMPAKLREIETFVRRRFYVQSGAGRPRAIKSLAEPWERRHIAARPDDRPYALSGRVAVIPIFGVISHRMNLLTYYSGGTSTQQLGRIVDQAAADPEVESIVFDVDSPGGCVFGVPELADHLFAMRERKRMVAVVNAMMCSAAYWLGCCAHEIVLTPSGLVGNIGVYQLHEDVSAANTMRGVEPTFIFAGRYKVEGNPYEPLGDEARAAIQAEVDFFYTRFANAVARGRGTTPEAVQTGFGEGRALTADQALAAKLCDRVDTFEAVLAAERRKAETGPLSALKARQQQLELEV